MNPRTLNSPLRALARLLPLRPAPTRLSRVRFFSEAAGVPQDEKELHEKEDKRISELETARIASDEKAKQLEEQVKELKKSIQYLQADYQTATRRGVEEKAKASEFAITKFARALLDTVDVLTTALKHVPQPIPAENKALVGLHRGVELTHKALLQTFEQHGVNKLDELKGQQFDPNLHEAIFTVPQAVAPKRENGESHGPNEIIDVHKDGWMIGQRVLRPAQVGVVSPEH
ncbi:hypothetical protein L204_102501 [Cryptococcus depauperatus]|nr:molecular chaperone GrpE [Cryptococcus depauperatus CBS 7855]